MRLDPYWRKWRTRLFRDTWLTFRRAMLLLDALEYNWRFDQRDVSTGVDAFGKHAVE